MKVAISLPDPLFAAAEQLAGQLKFSRSQLYAAALAEYLRSRDSAAVTDQLNRVYGGETSAVDPALSAAQARVLDREPW